MEKHGKKRLTCETIRLSETLRKIWMKWNWIVKTETCLLYSFFDYWIELVEQRYPTQRKIKLEQKCSQDGFGLSGLTCWIWIVRSCMLDLDCQDLHVGFGLLGLVCWVLTWIVGYSVLHGVGQDGF